MCRPDSDYLSLTRDPVLRGYSTRNGVLSSTLVKILSDLTRVVWTRLYFSRRSDTVKVSTPSKFKWRTCRLERNSWYLKTTTAEKVPGTLCLTVIIRPHTSLTGSSPTVTLTRVGRDTVTETRTGSGDVDRWETRTEGRCVVDPVDHLELRIRRLWSRDGSPLEYRLSEFDPHTTSRVFVDRFTLPVCHFRHLLVREGDRTRLT